MPKNEGDYYDCELCHKWHTKAFMCPPKMQRDYADMQAKVKLCDSMIVACEKGVRELVARPYNTPDEDKLFREMLKIIEAEK